MGKHQKQRYTIMLFTIMALGGMARPAKAAPCDTVTIGACQGEAVRLDAGFSGLFGPSVYQWERSNDGSTYSVVPNAASPSLTVGHFDTAGTFYYRATATNRRSRCTANLIVILKISPSPQGLTAFAADITCANPVATLSASAQPGGAMWAWSGPNGFTATSKTATTAMPGHYQVTATEPTTGCSATASVNVGENRPTITVAATGGTLSCKDSSVIVGAFSQKNGLAYAWSGPDGPAGAGANIGTDNPGLYEVTATDPASGCSAVATAEVIEDRDEPSVWAEGKAINCLAPKTILVATSDLPSARYWWTGPYGISLKKNPITVSQPGEYKVRAYDPNNHCSSPETTVHVILN